MVAIINETLINFVPICDIEIAMPAMNNLPQGLEGFGRASPHGQAPLGHRPWKPNETRKNEMVFIGRNLDAAQLKEDFRGCLV